MNELRNLKKGTLFTKNEIAYPNESQVWIKGDYVRSMKRFECYRYYDAKVEYMLPDKIVYTDMTFKGV